MHCATGQKSDMLELPMYLQRPSSARSQDVRHILSTTFHDYFNRDIITADKIEKLVQSQGECDDEYHNLYVDSLRKAYEEHERMMAEFAMLERHIMQAKARAMSADEREINRSGTSCNNYSELGLPPAPSCYHSCLDKDLLRKHDLLIPSDYASKQEITVPPPQPPAIPSYTQDTKVSMMRIKENIKAKVNQEPVDLEAQAFPSYISNEALSDWTPRSLTEQLKMKGAKLHTWKNQMLQEQRDKDRMDLASMEAKVNYLHNPRFDPPSAHSSLIKHKPKKAKQTGIVDIPDSTEPSRCDEPSQIFITSPSCILFENYSVGQIYQLMVKVQNVSRVMRACRMVPPETEYFYVDQGRFPGDHGLVAPGMSCVYTLSFSPDSLCDYDDVICIQSQAEQALKVPIKARRPPPVLSLPSELNVGHHLVGGKRSVQFIIKNTGGAGKFCVLPQSVWPATNFKSSVANSHLSVGPFEIHPSVFELMGGETGVIDVLFCPTDVMMYTEGLTIVCDNCHVMNLSLTGEGEMPDVYVEFIEGGETEPLIGEQLDPITDHHLRFDELMPFTYTDRAIHIRNKSNVDLQYQWVVYKPGPLPVVRGDDAVSTPQTMAPEQAVAINSVFGVYPQAGDLPADSLSTFKITFAPPVVGKFHNILHLILRNIPPKVHDSVTSIQSATGISTGSSLYHEDESISETSNIVHRDLSILQIDLKGECQPMNVVLKPYAMLLPGQFMVGSTTKKSFSMENYSVGMVKFHWESYNLDHIIEVEPQIGELGPNMGMDFELKITGIYPGSLEHDLACYIENMDAPLCLRVSVNFKGAEISIHQPDINFGLVPMGTTVTKEITMSNLSQLPSMFQIIEQNVADDSTHPGYNKFSISPNSGELAPLQTQKVEVKFEPVTTGSVKAIFEVHLKDGETSHISVMAEVQTPQVCLEKCEVEPAEVFINTPVEVPAVLLNQTFIPTHYHWGQPEGVNVADVELTIEPKQGSIGAHERVECGIHIMVLRSIEVTDLRLPCIIAGMDSPLYLSIICDVRNLSVICNTSTSGIMNEHCTSRLFLDFGDNVPLGSNPKLYLHIKNLSAIPASYTINIANLAARPPTPPGGELRKSEKRCGLLTKTPNLGDPNSKRPSKAHADMCRLMLTGNHGAAFCPSIPSGVVQPFEEEVIAITAYSDMWGVYTDKLIVSVDTLLPRVIPIKMTVVGSPLTFQALGPDPKCGLTLRMGTHTAGASDVKRAVRINNNGPCDIRLDWRVYDTRVKQTDLIELITYFGEAFPKKNSDGSEIVPCHVTEASDQKDLTASISHNQLVPPDGAPDGAPVIPHIVHICLRMRDGVPAETPFTVHPNQIVVPKRGHGIVHVWFQPPTPTEIMEITDFVGYSVGYLSLDEIDMENVNVTRQDAYCVEPIRMELAAKVSPVLLSVSYADEDEMSYTCSMSELISNNSSEVFKEASMTLSNNTEMPLTFKLRVSPPFLLTESDLWINKEEQNKTESEVGTLFPRQSLLVRIAFCLSLRVLQYMPQQAAVADARSQKEGNNNDDDMTRGTINIDKKAVIEFNTGVQMAIPLKATVFLPSFRLSLDTHDFGTCFVRQVRKLHLFISNPTFADSHWHVKIEEKSASCAEDTFHVEPASGVLRAHRTYTSDSQCRVTVSFNAKHEELYEAVLVFGGMLGEEPRRVYVTGAGSYDEKHITHLTT